MTNEQFIYWLRGYLEGKDILEYDQVDAIRITIDGLKTPMVFRDAIPTTPVWPMDGTAIKRTPPTYSTGENNWLGQLEWEKKCQDMSFTRAIK